jgi:hypothetical protein
MFRIIREKSKANKYSVHMNYRKIRKNTETALLYHRNTHSPKSLPRLLFGYLIQIALIAYKVCNTIIEDLSLI